MSEKTISREDAVRWIRTATKGHFFSVVFVKRTTKEQRTMLCRTGVHSHLKGGPPAYDAAAQGLVIVFDVAKMAFRSIPVEGLLSIRINGVLHSVQD